MNGPHDPRHGGGYPGHPPHPAPGYPPPPYPPQAKSNAGLVIGIIVALVLTIAVAATLYLTGVIGGSSKSGSGGSGSAAQLPITRENLVGSWSTEGDCSKHISEFTAAGDLWQHNLESSGGGTPPGRMGTWRLNGRFFTTSLEFGGGGPPLDVEYQIQSITADRVSATHDGQESQWVRCSTSLSGGASAVPTPSPAPATAPAPTSAPGPAPSTNPDVAALVRQAELQAESRLPIRNGPVTITSVNSNGNTFYMQGTIAADLTELQWNQLDTRMRTGICSGATANLVRMGGRILIAMEDSTGETREVEITRC